VIYILSMTQVYPSLCYASEKYRGRIRCAVVFVQSRCGFKTCVLLSWHRLETRLARGLLLSNYKASCSNSNLGLFLKLHRNVCSPQQHSVPVNLRVVGLN